jgi:transcriptional regulator of nitric oxide reductase
VLALAFVLWRKRGFAAAVAAVPAVYVFMLLLLGKMSTLTLPIVLLTLVMAIAVGAYREAEGEPPVSELEREEYEAFIAEEKKEETPDEDEIFYN